MTSGQTITLNLDMTLAQLEAEYIKAALKACGFNKTRTAEKLGIARATLYRKLAEHRITLKSFVSLV